MPNKSGAEHYDAAEKLLEEAESYQTPDTRRNGAWNWPRCT